MQKSIARLNDYLGVNYMDRSKIMIIANGKIVTSGVLDYEINNLTNTCVITFENNKAYPYNASNVSILCDPTSLNPQSYQIRYNGKYLYDISSIHVFKEADAEYWHICFSNGYEHDYSRGDLEIEKSVLDHEDAKRIFEYLREVAENIGPNTENGDSFLIKQYKKITFIDNKTAASAYLNPNDVQPKTDIDLATLIFPFGCNESQYQAVRNALANRISIIEGPPGTGKTQTILNIIANLVLQGKTIQVISNNNSAIDNVIEKMSAPQYGVEFIAARLGKNEKKDIFIEKQTGTYPDLSMWASDEYSTPEFFSSLQKKRSMLLEIFKDKNHLAELKQKLHSIQLEKKYFDDLTTDKSFVISGKPLSSEKLMEFWQEYQDIKNGNIKAGLSYRISRYYSMGISFRKIMKQDSATVMNRIQELYYSVVIDEIRSQISSIEEKLNNINADALMKEFTENSLKCFHAVLAKRYDYNKERMVFSKDSLWKNPNAFLIEYPVILSTTYTARSSLGKHAQFDYMIMDEASQVDVVTGTLSMSCAKSAVVVGDSKQLPNVVTSKQKEQLDSIFQKYNIPKAYDYSENSFLKSLCILFGERVPHVILREHYRCHPQIIGFCNEKFYHGDLIVMTPQDNMPVLQLVTTDVGSQEFNHTNMNQFEAIRSEILPELSVAKSRIGIISPYKNQVSMLKKRLEEPEIDIATVHKFQGREKDVIILSTVDDTATAFSDDPNLLNVAISRAKNKLVVVASSREQPVGSNIGDLIGYIRYNNCDFQHREIRPVFNCFYSKFEESRRKYLAKRKCISELYYEKKIYGMIIEELETREITTIGIICHQHMSRLLWDLSKMSEEEQRFIDTAIPQIDFLVFNRVTKMPLLAIEAEGLQYHKESYKKTAEDNLIKKILEKYGIPYLYLSGNDDSEKEKLKTELDKILRPSNNYTLVITEKPSVARAYAKVLGAQNKKYKYLEGNGYLISWCYGHLVELAEPGDYDEKYRHWNIEDLPIIPETWKYKIKSQKHLKKQFDVLKQLMNRDDVSEILCATDAGREGELIFRLVYQQAECEKPFRRIWLSSMEESSIKDAFANPKPASSYDTIFEAARGRQLADWIVGMNATRFFSCLYSKSGEPLNVGRVKSPTLAMIVDREKEIESFVPESYYTVNLDVGGIIFKSRRFESEDEAIQLEKKCSKAISTSTDVKAE